MSISAYQDSGRKSGNKVASEYASVDLETSINAASPHKLILMLYDGAITALFRAKILMEQKNIVEKGQEITKAVSIINDGLAACLNEEKGGDIARNLASLYDYMSRRLVEAHIQNKPEWVQEVVDLLKELRGAWEQIGNTATSTTEATPSLGQMSSVPNTGGSEPPISSAVSYGKV